MHNALINPINPAVHNNHHKQHQWCSEGEWMPDSPATSQHQEMTLPRAEGNSQRQDPHPARGWGTLPPELVSAECSPPSSPVSGQERILFSHKVFPGTFN